MSANSKAPATTNRSPADQNGGSSPRTTLTAAAFDAGEDDEADEREQDRTGRQDAPLRSPYTRLARAASPGQRS